MPGLSHWINIFGVKVDGTIRTLLHPRRLHIFQTQLTVFAFLFTTASVFQAQAQNFSCESAFNSQPQSISLAQTFISEQRKLGFSSGAVKIVEDLLLSQSISLDVAKLIVYGRGRRAVLELVSKKLLSEAEAKIIELEFRPIATFDRDENDPTFKLDPRLAVKYLKNTDRTFHFEKRGIPTSELSEWVLVETHSGVAISRLEILLDPMNPHRAEVEGLLTKPNERRKGFSELVLAFWLQQHPKVNTLISTLEGVNEAIFNSRIAAGDTKERALEFIPAYRMRRKLGFNKFQIVDRGDLILISQRIEGP